MTYREAVARLLALRGGEITGMRPGLERIEALLSAIGNPERRYTLVQVGGTNGKGSVSAMLAACLEAQGRRTGLYTSPHLVDFSERIRVDGRPIGEAQVVDGVEALGTLVARLDASVFEATTALALDHFASEGVEVAVLEVGLGGRLDSTTVGRPAAEIVARVDLDHQQFLGSTIEAIGAEKAAIIRSGIALSARQDPAVEALIVRRAAEVGVPLWVEGRDLHARVRAFSIDGQQLDLSGPGLALEDVRCRLLGAFQPGNALLAAGAARALGVEDAAIRARPRRGGVARALPGDPPRSGRRARRRAQPRRRAGAGRVARRVLPGPAGDAGARRLGRQGPRGHPRGAGAGRGAAHPDRLREPPGRGARGARAPRAGSRARAGARRLGGRGARARPRPAAHPRGLRRGLALPDRGSPGAAGRDPTATLTLARPGLVASIGGPMRRSPRVQPEPSVLRRAARLAIVAAGLAAGLLAAPAEAQPLGERAPLRLKPGVGEATILADRIEQIGGPSSLAIATGNVEISQGLTRLLADRVEINQDTGEAVAQGRVIFFDGQDRLVGDRIDYNLKTGTGVVHNGSALAAPYYRLSGERMERVGESVYSVRRGTFTTCEGDNPDWSFRVGEATAEIDEIVYGRDASFWVRQIPLIPWIPFFAAAIKRERQSGFLMPQTGYSSKKGFELGIPYYWVISDSQDATITPYIISERGIGLAAEYRYILSERQRGRLQGFMIPEFFRSDSEREEEGVPLLRGAVHYRHVWEPTERLSVKADVNYTSDDQIFRDYGNALTDRSRDRAETNVFVSHRWDAWSVVGNVLSYQDLTTTAKTELQRVPDIRLTGVKQPIPGTGRLPGLQHLLMEAEGSFTNFLRDVGPGGIRVDAHPRFTYPVPFGRWLTVSPFIGPRFTLYTQKVVGFTQVSGFNIEETVNDTRVRSQIEWGFEAETRAARVFPLGGTWGLEAVRHVIEPRVSYLEIRGINQKDNPQYEPQIDGIGKESRLAVSLTQRLYAKTVTGPNQEPIRWEAVRLTLAQPINLLDVGKGGSRNPWDDFAGELIVQPNWLFVFRAGTRYNYEGIGFREATVDVGATLKDVIATVGYRYDFDVNSNVLNAAIAARLHTNLDVHAATAYDLREGQAVENRFGLDFRFQCFTIMVEYVNRPNDENEIRVAIGLLGIGQTGSKIGAGGSTTR